MEFIENYDITHLTTFGIKVKTRYFAEYASERDLLRISRAPVFLDNEVLHIGGGSNLLFLSDYDGLILHSAIKGIKYYRKDENTVYAIVGGGETFNDFVRDAIAHNYAGVENLAGIPGEVGASAVQNIGAYGVEVCDVIHSVECFDLIERKTVQFSVDQCNYGYRDSVFKHEGKNRYAVIRVAFKLNPDGVPRTLHYGPVRKFVEGLDHEPTLTEIADEIVKIRDSKIPNPRVMGNAGSFFKNPVIDRWFHAEIQKHAGMDIPVHPVDDNENDNDSRVKISAAWLIDQAGMKGVAVGGAKVNEKQPLVIVNTGNATAHDVKELAERVRRAVRKKFLINLQPEVNYIDTTTTITVLGSGTSKGVPEMTCDCDVCHSTDPKDKRRRASVYVETQQLRLLIDASPDLRMQALDAAIYDVDAVLITHSHYDHVGGIDDLRPFCLQKSLPLYVRSDVDRDLRARLDYCFREHLYPGVPTFDMKIVDGSEFTINGVKITPIDVLHGKLPIWGYRIGNFAYVTDAKTIAESERDKLRDLDVLIVNSLRDKPHFAHFNLEESLELIADVKPKRAYLTHFNHEMGFHKDLEKRLPPNVYPAYDGLVIKC